MLTKTTKNRYLKLKGNKIEQNTILILKKSDCIDIDMLFIA